MKNQRQDQIIEENQGGLKIETNQTKGSEERMKNQNKRKYLNEIMNIQIQEERSQIQKLK